MHGTIESSLRSWSTGRSPSLRPIVPRLARACRPGARRRTSSTSRPLRSPPRRCSGRDVGAASGVVARRAASADRTVPGADRAPPLRRGPAAAGRLDASLCAARRTADRSRLRRDGRCRLARPCRQRPDAAEAHAAAASAARRRLRRCTRGARCRAERGAASISRRMRAPCLRRQGDAPAISTTPSAARSARSCAGSASGSRDSGLVATVTAASPLTPPRARSRHSLRSEAAGWKGRAGTAARRDAGDRRFRAYRRSCARRRGQGADRPARASADEPIAAIVTLRSGERRLVLEDRL